MDTIVKQTIDARKDAIFNSYEVTDKKMLEKIDDLFKRINEFGESFSDVTTFESEFASNPLNTEYTNIFVELAKKDIKTQTPGVGKMVAERVGRDIKNSIIPSRAVRADKRDQAIRNIPVIGDIVDAKQKIDFFSRFKKNKD